MDAEQQAKNRTLGELLGWTAKELPHKYGTGTYWILINPDGKCVYSFGGGNESGEVQVWKHTPDWYGSVDAALAILPDGATVKLYAPLTHGTYAAEIITADHWWTGRGANYAEALANAVLQMTLAGKEAGRG